MKTEAEPVRSYLIDRLIKKYVRTSKLTDGLFQVLTVVHVAAQLESTWAYLESEGKHEEAQASREERTKNEKEAETRRMQAAQEKNRRAAAAAAALAERQGGANRMFQIQAARAGAAGMPLQMPAQRARLVAAARGQPVRGGRGARGAAAAAAQAQAQAQAAAAAPPPAAAGHILGVPAAQNNANQFGNLLQHRDGALQVDPHVLQQRANEMGVPVADLFNILFRG